MRNIETNPRVRVKGSLSVSDWRGGTARILDDDDPEERIRILGRGNRWRRLRLQTSAAMNTNPLTVRSDLDHQEVAASGAALRRTRRVNWETADGCHRLPCT